MEVTLPIKRLNSLSWLLAVIASIIVYIVLAQDPTQRHKFLGVTESITGIALIGHIDVLCMVILVKRFGIKTKKFNQYRYLFTFPASIVAYLLIWPIFFYFQQGNWAFWEMR
jgi:two-component system LytT family sensor kinase